MPLYSRHAPVSKIRMIIILLLFCAVLFPGCDKTTTVPSSPSGLAPDTPAKVDTSLSLDSRRPVTAAASFPKALIAARTWRQDVQWYGVILYTSIERAFAIPLKDDQPSWYFRFGVPGGEQECVIEVLGGQVVGINETKIPDYIEPPLADLEPLGDTWSVIDNVVVLETYRKEEGSLLAQFPNMLIDYRLAQPKGQSHPIWTLYNAQDLTKPIFMMDARTGAPIPVK